MSADAKEEVVDIEHGKPADPISRESTLNIEEPPTGKSSGFVSIGGKQVSTRLLLIIAVSVGGAAAVGLAIGLGVSLSAGTIIIIVSIP